MTGWVPQSHISKEDLAIQAKWMRRLAVVYGAALLLLVAFLAANHMLADQKSTADFASAPAPNLAHAPAVSARQAD
jgi:hypothetical protein